MNIIGNCNNVGIVFIKNVLMNGFLDQKHILVLYVEKIPVVVNKIFILING